MTEVLTTVAFLSIIIIFGAFLAGEVTHQVPIRPETDHGETIAIPSSTELQKAASGTQTGEREKMPVLPNKDPGFKPNDFHGPTGQPHIIGPQSGPPY